MKRNWGIFALLASFICSGSPGLSAESGWSLNQTATSGAALGGGMTIYISPNGLRSYEPKSGVSLLTHGPNWTVYIFNTKTKRMFSTQLQPWLQSFKQRNLVGRFQGASWKRGNPNGQVAGVRAYEFVMDKAPPVRTSSKSINGKIQQYGAIQAASLWVASDIKTPQQVSDILCNLYGVPDTQRIPLRVTLTQGGKTSTAVNTTTAARMNIPDNIFAVPTGYQMVKQDSDVFIDKESMDTLDEMLNDLDSPSTRRPTQRPGYPQQRPGYPQQRPGYPQQRR